MLITPAVNQDKIDLTTELFLTRINEKYDLKKQFSLGVMRDMRLVNKVI